MGAMDNLSATRKAALAFVRSVVPSVDGSQQFLALSRMTSETIAKKQEESEKQGKKYTTCGCLPGHIAQQLGAVGLITSAATTGLPKFAGGAWVPAGTAGKDDPLRRLSLTMPGQFDLSKPVTLTPPSAIAPRAQPSIAPISDWSFGGAQNPSLLEALKMQDALSQRYGKRPLPGDFYALTNNGQASGIVHVGIIMDASGDVWKTADAGQTDQATGKQAAKFVDRKYDGFNGTLTGEVTQNNGAPRKLLGWVDIDLLMNPQSMAA